MTTVNEIQQAVSHEYGVSVAALNGRTRLREIVYPRQVAMFLCRKLCKVHLNGGKQNGRLSLVGIGRRFGNRDHTTVISALRAVKKRRAEDPELRAAMGRLFRELGRR